MKKHLLTVALGLLMGTSAFAQVEFVDDATGKVVPDGSTIVRNTIETTKVPNTEMIVLQEIKSGLSAKNTSAVTVQVNSQVDVTDLPFGQFALCFPGSCWINVPDWKATYPTHKPIQPNLSADGPWTSSTSGSLGAGKSQSLESEWKISSIGNATWDGSVGSFTATYSLLVNNSVVSTVKVLYTTDQKSTGIAGVYTESDSKTVAATYNTAGQQVATGSKGLHIVKYSDGSTKKVVVK